MISCAPACYDCRMSNDQNNKLQMQAAAALAHRCTITTDPVLKLDLWGKAHSLLDPLKKDSPRAELDLGILAEHMGRNLFILSPDDPQLTEHQDLMLDFILVAADCYYAVSQAPRGMFIGADRHVRGIAQNALAGLFENGLLGEPDPVAAFRLRRSAAHDGFAEAQISLGIMHYRGDGVPLDKSASLYWMRKAIANADQLAPEMLANIKEYEQQIAGELCLTAPTRPASKTPPTASQKP